MFTGRVAEGRLWLSRALARPGLASAPRAAALWACALLASQQGDLGSAGTLATQAQEVAAAVGDELTVARALSRLAILATFRGDRDRADSLQAEAMSRYQELGQGDGPYAVTARLTLAASRLSHGDPAGGARMAGECAASCRAHGDRILLANSLTSMAHAQWLMGEHTAAIAHVREALRLRGAGTAPLNLAQLVELLAWITAGAGEAREAAVLLGAAYRAWRTYGLHKLLGAAFYREPHEAARARLRAQLGDTDFEDCFGQGAALRIEEIVARAAAAPAGTGTAPGRPARQPAQLTRREREVAALVAEGLSNREIAERLLVSQRTAESHIEHILHKLGFASRARIAAWAIRQGGTRG